ncbi:hypothetical protein CHLNCDRAFT_132908 [Chlorella variabilis]|uniref:HIG1 domain-containing protein n=1 Tax=Chlorella variabilis TaxID=554065 RepID=E1Z1X4_CHLVA|nr:hypothetical protein CHLNCDRAFT_132908 [Chlorella variabilis]EFN59892.1 hypothetical protein CHLNCDRAFT_132908 [Chlorella variabilis]|eukprot:XP_005851994.1 hypothetical protein CHLNCDRAFT_132908 [Chlorella variabilis]
MSSSSVEDLRRWVVQNKLKAIFSFWATGLSVSLAYQWTRPIPTQLKLIHSRVYAQALTLAGLGIAGVVQWLEEPPPETTPAPKATGFDR